MIVLGGEAYNADMNDLWALDLEASKWLKLSINNADCFKAKRFHTVSALSRNKIISFGGCHSEYDHLNDINIFDMSRFLENSVTQVACSKLIFRDS